MGEEIVILDGGFTTVLHNRGYKLHNDPLWSARFLHTEPAVVVEVHKNYLESGCDIITTASYQATIDGFQKHLNISLEESIGLIRLSVQLAKEAVKDYLKTSCSDKNILIAGSVGPYGAFCADGSEYTGNYCDQLSYEELIEWHRPRVKCLVEAGVDLIAFETMPAAKEGEALLKLLGDYPWVKAWLSFSCQSLHKTAHGENLSLVAKNCLKLPSAHQLVAIGVNCCPPAYVTSLLKDISDVAPGFPLIAYPNSGEKWDSKTGWSSEKGRPISEYVHEWKQNSAKYIGGCCRTGPEDIAAIVKILRNKRF